MARTFGLLLHTYMTLIAGAIGWGGVYLVSDTRVTKRSDKGSYSYKDDILKCEITKGGLAMAVSGSVYVNTLLKNDLEKRLTNWYEDVLVKKSNGYKFTQTPQEVLIQHIEDSLRDVFTTDEVMAMPSEDSIIKGLIALIDNFPMRLNQVECKLLGNLIAIPNVKNETINKYRGDIEDCIKGKKSEVKISEYKQGCLVYYESVAQSHNSMGKLEVSGVKFGEIKAFGSGVSPTHIADSQDTLKYMLCDTNPTDYSSIAFHLTRTIGLSDSQVPADPLIGFKTFGGGVIPAFLLSYGADSSNIGIASLLVVEGDIRRKSDGSIFSEAGHDAKGNVWVTTSEGNKETLTKFSEYKSKDKLFTNG